MERKDKRSCKVNESTLEELLEYQKIFEERSKDENNSLVWRELNKEFFDDITIRIKNKMDNEQKQLMEAILNQLKKMNETLEKHLGIIPNNLWNHMNGFEEINNRINLND